MSWVDDFFIEEKDKRYYTKWRKHKKSRWNDTQLKWYYKYRPAILDGWKKPESEKPDKYDRRRYGENYGETETVK